MFRGVVFNDVRIEPRDEFRRANWFVRKDHRIDRKAFLHADGGDAVASPGGSSSVAVLPLLTQSLKISLRDQGRVEIVAEVGLVGEGRPGDGIGHPGLGRGIRDARSFQIYTVEMQEHF